MEKKSKTIAKGKNIKDNIEKKEITSNWSGYLGEYRDLITYLKKPYDLNFIESLAHDLMNYVRLDYKKLDMSEFLRERGIPSSTYYYWVEKYPELKEAHNEVVTYLGKNREIGIVQRVYEPGWTGRSLRMYLPEWSENEEWYAKVKQNEQNTAQTINVILEKFPETDIVPKKVIE